MRQPPVDPAIATSVWPGSARSQQTVNAPSSTDRYFTLARQPKFLLSLLGAPHLGPYTDEEPQLGIVERVTLAFLDRYLKHQPGARARMWNDGNVPNLASLSS